MADVAIETSCQSYHYQVAQRGGPFWVSPTVGYFIYVNNLDDLKYQKTADGGANWGGAVNIRTGSVLSYDCWADWQTEGDSGTKIHIACIDAGSNDVRYVYLDTNGDSVGGDDQIEAAQGCGTIDTSVSRSNHQITITKSRGGNIAVAFRYMDDNNAYFYMFYTSPDGDTWTSEASPWDANLDLLLLFPGNEADNQDLWATLWDASEDKICLLTYDDSGDSWSSQDISANMADLYLYMQMDGAIRLSDGHLIFAAWSEIDTATADLMVWDINGAGSITAKTNVITDEAETFMVSVFINQDNDDVYIAYVSGTAAFSTVQTFYQKSGDGCANWGGETAMQADAADDERWLSAGCMKAAWGGKFQPCWFNDDLNDLFTNTDNGISIAASAAARRIFVTHT